MKKLALVVSFLVVTAFAAHAQVTSSTTGYMGALLIVSDSGTLSPTILMPNTSAPATCNSGNDGLVALNAKRQPCYCNGPANQWQQMGINTTGITIGGIGVLNNAAAAAVGCPWNP